MDFLRFRKIFFSIAFFSAVFLVFGSVNAKELSKKGSFGVVVQGNYVKLDYKLIYLGTDYKEGCIAFKFEVEDPKGLYIGEEVVEDETKIKTFGNDEFKGTLEDRTERGFVMIFPDDKSIHESRKIKVYTRIRDYKFKTDLKTRR